MKKYLVSLSLILMAFTCSSQVLTPIVNVSFCDTFFCFSQSQCRVLAGHLVNGQYCDSLRKQSEQEIVQWQKLDSTNQKTICLLEEKLRNHKGIIVQQEGLVLALSSQVKVSTDFLQQTNRKKRLYKTGFLIVSGLSLALLASSIR